MFSCSKCDISLQCNHQVYGVGSKSDIMFIGENPGYKEDKLNIPFVGKSGKLLDKYLDVCGFDRDYIYITNIVKCKTPRNRPPNSLEISNCRGYLIKEIIDVKPKIIVTLGKTAYDGLFNVSDVNYKFTKLTGKWFKWNTINCIALPHPSYILRYPEMEDLYFEDFKKIVDKYREYHNFHKVNY